MSTPAPAGEERAPLAFIVVVGLAVLYLVVRLVQMIGWLLAWLL